MAGPEYPCCDITGVKNISIVWRPLMEAFLVMGTGAALQAFEEAGLIFVFQEDRW